MVQVRFPRHILRHYDVPTTCTASGSTVADLVRDVERQFPGLTDYFVDERGAMRKHVNIFIGEQPIRDRERLSDTVTDGAEVFVMQALSGG